MVFQRTKQKYKSCLLSLFIVKYYEYYRQFRRISTNLWRDQGVSQKRKQQQQQQQKPIKKLKIAHQHILTSSYRSIRITKKKHLCDIAAYGPRLHRLPLSKPRILIPHDQPQAPPNRKKYLLFFVRYLRLWRCFLLSVIITNCVWIPSDQVAIR